MKDLKSPLRYPGGKSRAVKFLFDEKNLPEAQVNEYREPFLGGGSCAIEFTKKFPKTPVWVNDKYYNLYSFWVTLKRDGEKLAKFLHKKKTSLEESVDPQQAHLDMFPVLKEGIKTASSEFERAWMFYMLNRCSFSGLGETAGSFSKIAINSNFNHKIIDRLPRFQELIQKWHITNYDYAELLDGDDDAFVFCDPPYDIKSFIYGDEGNMHSGFDHKKFHDDVDSCNNMVMVTYNSNDTLKKAYTGWEQTEWDLTYTMHSSKKYREDESNRKELLLTNYVRKKQACLDFS
jgi:site-specific DNA-adenine methylase